MRRSKSGNQSSRLATATSSAMESRRQIAYMAARLIADEGLTDYAAAKLKAARSLGCNTREELPDNREIEAAVRDHLAIFQQASQPVELRKLREIAIVVMRRLQRFSPLLRGAVAVGTANRFSSVELDVLVNEDKALDLFLMNENIDYSICAASDENARHKSLHYEFTFYDVQILVTAFMAAAERSCSVSRNGARKEGIDIVAVEQLLQTT